jgi:DNA-binding Lrp family transcriptional regulator
MNNGVLTYKKRLPKKCHKIETFIFLTLQSLDMAIKLDLKDKKILYELDLNARQNNSKIAKKVGLSKDAITYRIKKLEEAGIIKGYRAVIDSARLGFVFYRVFLNLIDMQPHNSKALIEFLENNKNIWWIAKLDGEWNFSFATWTKSNKEFKILYDEIKLNFRKNIKEEIISPMLSYKNFSRKYLIENPKEIKSTSVGEGDKQDIDNIDLKILNYLAENARIPLIEIANNLKLDSMTIKHRIKKMEQNKIIQGYNADINFRKLGRDFYSVKINLKETQQIETIKDFILTLPEITAYTEAIGSYDIEFDLEVEDSERYFKIVETLENKFDFIREIIYFRVLKGFKMRYMPEV